MSIRRGIPKYDASAAYAAFYEMRQGFEQALSAMQRMQASGVKRGALFEGSQILLAEAAAWACHQAMEALREREFAAWAQCARKSEEWRKNLENPIGDPVPPLRDNRRRGVKNRETV